MRKYLNFPFFSLEFPDPSSVRDSYLEKKATSQNIFRIFYNKRGKVEYPPQVEIEYKGKKAIFKANFFSGTVDLETQEVYLEFPEEINLWELLIYVVGTLTYKYPFFMCHSSSGIDSEGNAYLFIGVSGSGKSTALEVFSLQKINEDRSFLSDSGKVILNPFEQKVVFKEMRIFKLQKVFFLVGKGHNKITPLKEVAQIFSFLFPHLFFFSKQKEYKSKLIDRAGEFILNSLSKGIKFYALSFEKASGKDWWQGEIQDK